jgi:hypothetical protein
VQAELEDVRDVGRDQDGHVGRGEGQLALVRDGGGFAAVVVAGHDQHAAVAGGAGVVGVAEDVTTAVHAGALAVPVGEDAVVFGALEVGELLGAPDGGGGEFLVHAGAEDDVGFLDALAGGPHLDVHAAEGGAAVAGDVAGGVEAGLLVQLALQQGKADEGLGAGEEEPVGADLVLVVQRDRGVLHGRGPLANSR